MKTIQVKLYKFSELSEEAKETAVNKERERRYNDTDLAQFAIDDDYLFEPKHEDLVKVFGEKYNELFDTAKANPMLGNTRKNLLFDYDRGQYIDCELSLEVNNDGLFLTWLGIPKELHIYLEYNIYTPMYRGSNTKIEFTVFDKENEFTEEETSLLEDASEKFSDHLSDVLQRIGESIEYNFTDKAITEELEQNDSDFTEDGKLY